MNYRREEELPFSPEFIRELQWEARKIAYGKLEIVIKAGKPIQLITSEVTLWKEKEPESVPLTLILTDPQLHATTRVGTDFIAASRFRV